MASVIASNFEAAIAIPEIIQPLSHRAVPTAEELLDKIPENVEDNYIDALDAVSFDQQLIKEDIAPKLSHVTDAGPTKSTSAEGSIDEGTWGGTQLALKEFYNRVEMSYGVYFAALGVETPIAQVVTERAKLFPWSDPADKYPPHFALPVGGGKEPEGYAASSWEIFNRLGLLQTAEMLPKIVPDTFLGSFSKSIKEKVDALLYGDSSKSLSMSELEDNNRNNRKTATDVMQGKNIGDLDDWWSDAKFGQQQFTGTNPVTITVASDRWLKEFTEAATAQDTSVGKAAHEFLQKADAKSLFIQDFTFFREAIGAKADAAMKCEAKDSTRYTVATVSLFHLTERGILHPIGICIDYKESLTKSVVIFNKNLEPASEWDPERDNKLEDEKKDWPWRYAKQCAQSADWIRHEIGSHLTHTHLIEEAVLVAANRTLDIKHPVFRLLEPHWYRTLPLNAGARATLVPKIIFDLIGMKENEPFDLVKYFFKTFDFTGCYIPNDLTRRGFPLNDLDSEKHRNYVYAKNMKGMWAAIRQFVKSMLELHYTSDQAVASDQSIQSWCHETQTKGQVTTFPTIKTFDELVDACTMCIHIASPQHTAVNYLQNFYHVFLPAKPPALWQAPPSSLTELNKYTEQHVLKSLPIGHQREWLLATQIPWLLSFKTADEHSLLKYSQQLYSLVRKARSDTDAKTKDIAAKFYKDLRDLVIAFTRNSERMTRGSIPYVVMDPASTAVSILI